LINLEDIGEARKYRCIAKSESHPKDAFFLFIFVAPPAVSDRNFCDILNNKLALLHDANVAQNGYIDHAFDGA
jgi:hypothetical protein